MRKTLAGTSSASIRKTFNGIAAATGRKPKHTRYPSLDLQISLNEIPKDMQKKAIEWYRPRSLGWHCVPRRAAREDRQLLCSRRHKDLNRRGTS